MQAHAHAHAQSHAHAQAQARAQAQRGRLYIGPHYHSAYKLCSPPPVGIVRAVGLKSVDVSNIRSTPTLAGIVEGELGVVVVVVF